jgi:hypothetical protein
MIVIRENSLVATKNYSTSFIAIKIYKFTSLPSNSFSVSLIAISVKTYEVTVADSWAPPFTSVTVASSPSLSPCARRRSTTDGRAAIPEAPASGKLRRAQGSTERVAKRAMIYELTRGDGCERAQVRQRLASGGASSQRGRDIAGRPREGSSTSELGARVRDSSAGAWRGSFGAGRPRADSGERHAKTAMTSGPARGTSEVAAKRAGRSRGGSDTLSPCLLRSVGRRCGDVGTESMHRVARAMARGVDHRSVGADVRVTDPIRSGVALCIEALDLGGVCVEVEGRSWAASASGITSSASAIGESTRRYGKQKFRARIVLFQILGSGVA